MKFRARIVLEEEYEVDPRDYDSKNVNAMIESDRANYIQELKELGGLLGDMGYKINVWVVIE